MMNVKDTTSFVSKTVQESNNLGLEEAQPLSDREWSTSTATARQASRTPFFNSAKQYSKDFGRKINTQIGFPAYCMIFSFIFLLLGLIPRIAQVRQYKPASWPPGSSLAGDIHNSSNSVCPYNSTLPPLPHAVNLVCSKQWGYVYSTQSITFIISFIILTLIMVLFVSLPILLKERNRESTWTDKLPLQDIKLPTTSADEPSLEDIKLPTRGEMFFSGMGIGYFLLTLIQGFWMFYCDQYEQSGYQFPGAVPRVSSK